MLLRFWGARVSPGWSRVSLHRGSSQRRHVSRKLPAVQPSQEQLPTTASQPSTFLGTVTPKSQKQLEQKVSEMTAKAVSNKTHAQLLREKFGVGLDANDTDPAIVKQNARRLAQIFSMPMQDATPIIRKKVDLFTTDVEEYFSKFPRNAVTYNTLILGLAERSLISEARLALEDMKKHGVMPTAYHYTSLMKAFVLSPNPDAALLLLREMKSSGVAPTIWTMDVLLESAVAAGQLDRAFELYDLIKEYQLSPNVEIFTTLIKGCAAIDKDYQRAWSTFDHMRVYYCEPDSVLYTLMIHICAKEGRIEKAMNLLDELRQMGHRPTDVTFDSLIYACSRRIDFYDEAFTLLEQMKSEGFVPSVITLLNVLNVCAKSGDVRTAELTFDEIVRMSEVQTEHPYSLMIETYANAMYLRGEKDNSSELISMGEKVFERMISSGVTPTVFSLNNRLRLYAQARRLNRAIEIKDEMKSVYGVSPTVRTYNVLINMFAHARRMERAFDQFNIMRAVDKIEPNEKTYVALVTGCTKMYYVQSGMKLLREMKDNNMLDDFDAKWLNDFRRQLTKFPWLIREIDEMSGKADRPVAPWKYPGVRRKTRYYRELTPEEKKRSPLYR